MGKSFTIKKYWIVTILIIFGSLSCMAQELTDKEIGFDLERVTNELKARGLTAESLDSEIELMRETYKVQYLDMKKNEDEILQRVKLDPKNKGGKGKSVVLDVSPAEKEALLALYNSTGGSNWANKTGWNFSTTVTSWDNVAKTGWYGVVVNNGQIVSLNLNTNNLIGYIPIEIGQLKYVETLYLQNNYLSGPIPATIGGAKSLLALCLQNNVLTGTIPEEIGQLINLKSLFLNSNKFNGSMPSGICNLTSLSSLYLNLNGLTGIIPLQIGNLSQMQILDFGYNKLSGNIPLSLYDLKYLSTFFVNDNGLNGTLSSDINKLIYLKDFRLSNNQFSGIIPSQIGQLSRLQTLDIRNNQFTGPLPKELGQLLILESFLADANKLSGTIPSEIGLMKRLKLLWIDSNELTGPIPAEIGNLTSLQSIYLRNNHLTGNIPEGIKLLVNVNLLALYGNSLEGPIPDLSNLALLSRLEIKNNKFRFVDFADQFLSYKAKMGTGFQYSGQEKTDIAKTITPKIGESVTLTMLEDGRFKVNDTFQWYKNNTVISGATSRVYTVTNVKDTDSGTYTCLSSHISSPDMSPLILEREPITLSTVVCTPIVGTFKIPVGKISTSEESIFSFESLNTGLTYLWTTETPAGQVLNTSNSEKTYSYTFPVEGDYVVRLMVRDIKGCTATFTGNIKAVNLYCAKEAVNFIIETTSTNLNCIWTAKDSHGIVVNQVANNSGSYKFIPQLAGEYVIELKANGTVNCETLFSKKIDVENCIAFVSCTKTNPNTATIKSIFTTLATKLLNLPAGTVTNGYTCPELTALKSYIKDANPAIYNFVHNTEQGFIAFSFGNHTSYDVKIATTGNAIASFNLDQYESNTILTELRTDSNDHFENFVNHIDFCSELYCVSHVAIVVDESGSIAPTEAAKIKKQLKKYIQQQANENDNLQSNIYVSLIGMSDSDTNTRTDNVTAIRVTNEDPAVLKKFNNWIDKYGTRNGSPGVSASSDYWKSGLDVALNSVIKPNIVMMVTDGCETSNVTRLKDETMSRFNNSKSTVNSSIDKPHLYVVGIENGFYVDGGLNVGSLAHNEDPNYVQTLTGNVESRVVPILRTSLKYLFSYPETEFPQASIDDFRSGDYYGYENFDALGTMENETYFSDKLKIGKFICGEPSDKNYCSDCLSFQPVPEKEYMLSAWVKEESFIQVKTYENAVINVIFYSDVKAEDLYRISTEKLLASGDIIDGWQRITAKFLIPKGTKTIGIELENKSSGIPAYYDDIRIHPLEGSMKTFVYDSETFKLMSELDENNYSTFYEYDNEGGLVRIKKETAKGIKTIQETRSGNIITN